MKTLNFKHYTIATLLLLTTIVAIGFAAFASIRRDTSTLLATSFARRIIEDDKTAISLSALRNKSDDLLGVFIQYQKTPKLSKDNSYGIFKLKSKYRLRALNPPVRDKCGIWIDEEIVQLSPEDVKLIYLDDVSDARMLSVPRDRINELEIDFETMNLYDFVSKWMP